MKIYYVIFLMVFINGCAGFYSKDKANGNTIKFNAKEVYIDVKYLQDGKLLDSLSIENDSGLKRRTELILNSIRTTNVDVQALAKFDKKNINPKKCYLMIDTQETSNPKNMLYSTLTLGVLPYVGKYQIDIDVKLMKNDIILTHVKNKNKFYIGFSLFFMPLYPFWGPDEAITEAYLDTYNQSMALINFEECNE